MKNQRKNVPWPLLWMSVTMFFILLKGFPSIAGSYPPYFTPSYSGMFKPQLNLIDYDGTPNAGHYSTVWGGKYSSPTSPPPESSITPTPGIGEFTGRHAGVDITLGECYPTEPTEIRAVADGEVVGIVRNWIESNPGFTECGNNWAKFIVTPPTPTPVIYGLFGNYVIIKHNNFPEMGNHFEGTIYSIYTHLYSVEEDININDIVLRGTLLGYQGSTGYSSGPHLHFQIDRDISGKETHPYSYGNANEPYTPLLAEETFNPMYFVQAHIVQNEFSSDIQADYFMNKDFQGQPEETKFESSIDNDWYLNGPPGIPLNDEFSIRWGTLSGAQALYIPQSGWWYFYITVNDGFRLWVDETLILQDWTNHSYPTLFSIGTFMSQGIHTIKIEYYEDTGYATIQLAWQRHTYEQMLPLSQKHYSPDLPTPTPSATLMPPPSATPTPSKTPTRTPTVTPSPTPCYADLSIEEKKVNNALGYFILGLPDDYLITVRNSGPCGTYNVQVRDQLPATLAFASASGSGWTCSHDSENHDVTCTHSGPLSSGEETQISLFVTPMASGEVTNIANVLLGANPDPDMSNNHKELTHDVNPGNLADFDGDGDSDIALFRPAAGSWHHYGGDTVFLGQPGDIPVPADYDGDGKAERSFFRPVTGEWTICDEIDVSSGTCDPSTYLFGQQGDIPAPADYDGDGAAELAYFRPGTGTWSICRTLPDVNSPCAPESHSFGQAGDIPVPADYDGDWQAEMAYFRPSSGLWSICSEIVQIDVETCLLDNFIFGQQGDIPVPGDYDRDHQAERAIFRPGSGLWSICTEIVDITESTCLLDEYSLGQNGDIPVPGDYDGDGWTDLAFFRPATGLWQICPPPDISSGNCIPQVYYYGQTGDIPAEKRPSYTGYPY